MRLPALFALALLLGASALAAQPPAGYYDTVDATDATSLRATLHDVIDDHTRFPYTDTSTDTWDIVNLADEDPNNTANIIDIYKNASYTKIPGGVGAYNREHSWPKSYGFPDDNVDNYPYTDTHHLFACDGGYNSSRSNKPFRLCNAGCSENTTDLNDGRGGGSGVYPGNSNWTTGSFAQGTWETWDGRKGDVARAILYMDIRYEGGNHGGTGSAEPDLIVTDSEALIDSGNTGNNESVAYMGMLSVLLQWHAQDPVDSYEIWRNEVVYSFQGNRNPFIDHPEWAECLHNNLCGTGDTTPPAAPTGLVAVAGTGLVDLMWNASSEPDLAGYHVYRATTSGGPYARITGSVETNAFYTDSGLTAGTTYYYVVTAVDTSANESADSNEASATPSGGGGGGGDVVLSEVLYDVSSGDDGFEWVEIYNSGSSAADLSGFCLANGGTDYTYSTVQLSGSVASGATFVVGGPTSSGTNANPVYDQVANFSPDFQNSGSTGDGVALFDVPCAQVNGATVPIDAVVYGSNNNSGLIDETGSANAPEVGDASAGSSIERTSLAGAWQIQSSPTPNSTTLPPPAGNQAPSVTISAPADGSNFSEGTSISFSGSATDPEDGSLTASLSWSSNLDGAIGTGGSFSAVLSVGVHTVTASVTDSGGLGGSDQISVTVNPNTAPSVTISAPADGSTFDEGTSISFSGSATDAEDGSLTASLSWTSSIDGAIGSGGSFSAVLSVGVHTVTASVTDSGGLGGSDQISVTIDAVAPSGGDLLLSEVLYDVGGTDDGLEWVEIYNNDTVAIDLSGFSLGNGGTDYTTSLVQLSGTIQPGAIFVVGGPTSSAANGNPALDLAVNFNPDFQNSGTTGDGVALFNVPATSVTGSTVPIDAVVYGPNNNNGLIDESGSVGAPEVGDASADSSIERIDVGGNWQIQSTPTPNSSPLGTPPNTAPSVTISAPTNGSSFDEGISVGFTGSANDAEDGDITASLSWSSSIDGTIGTGGSFSTSTLSVGAHTITASVTDSGGLGGSDQITVTIDAVSGPVEVTFTSIAAEDGWVRESSENSNVGGARNTTGAGKSALRPGDHKNDRQYKAVVSFDTSSIPDGATIVSATLRLRRGKVTGTNPFTTHGVCWVDVHSGGLGGSTALANGDFEAAASVAKSTTLSSPAADGDWSEGSLDPVGLTAVDKTGTTQLRFYFDLDDNDDGGNDYMGYYSANNGTAGNHPQLVVTYQE
ncbi:MAG: DNRLRE domain-containing protein [bacterium]|nr:DNRLRE domain-containing protein [bacterium]